MQNRPYNLIAGVSSSAATLVNPGTITGGTNSGSGENLYIIITHMRALNHTTSQQTVSLFISSASGTDPTGAEFAWSASPIPPQTSGTNWLDWYGRVRLDVTDYLNGFASNASSVTLEIDGEIGVA